MSPHKDAGMKAIILPQQVLPTTIISCCGGGSHFNLHALILPFAEVTHPLAEVPSFITSTMFLFHSCEQKQANIQYQP